MDISKIVDIINKFDENNKVSLARKLIEEINKLEIEWLDEDILEYVVISYASLSTKEKEQINMTLIHFIESKIEEYELINNFL